MNLDSGRRRRPWSKFDIAQWADLGEPDTFNWGGFSKDPGFAKWTVQEAPVSFRGVSLPERAIREPDEVEVHFTGKLLDGAVFASSKEINDTPIRFKLERDDVNHVMEGFRLAVASMQPGEKAVFTIPQAWQWTQSGHPANIPWNMPPNQTLRFDIEFISHIAYIFPDQGVIKKTIKFGARTKKFPVNQDEVLVKYNACLEDGTSISKSEVVEFSLAQGFFCPAFAHVVRTMTEGEEAIVVINKPEYGFGEQGRPSTGNETAATLCVNLQLISFKEVTYIGENREIVKRRLRKGFYMTPRNGAVVKVRLTGKLQDETIFDSRGHNGDDPFEFTIDEEHVIYGLDEAVMTMTKGEIASFTIPPQHAFGAVESNQHAPTVIPANSIVTYEIELVSFLDEMPCERDWLFPNKTVIEIAHKKEREGNDLFELGKYLRAYRRYLRARQILRSSPSQRDAIDHLKRTFKNDKYRAAEIQDCKKAYVDVKKILISLAFKSAECAMQLQRYKQASDRYHEVLEYDPKNREALEMLAKTPQEPPVEIDADAMHRGLENELPPPSPLYGASSMRRSKKSIRNRSTDANPGQRSCCCVCLYNVM